MGLTPAVLSHAPDSAPCPTNRVRSRRLAPRVLLWRYHGVSPVALSIVPLLVLYWSCIVPLLFTLFHCVMSGGKMWAVIPVGTFLQAGWVEVSTIA